MAVVDKTELSFAIGFESKYKATRNRFGRKHFLCMASFCAALQDDFLLSFEWKKKLVKIQWFAIVYKIKCAL